jgi:hypothetical protein
MSLIAAVALLAGGLLAILIAYKITDAITAAYRRWRGRS